MHELTAAAPTPETRTVRRARRRIDAPAPPRSTDLHPSESLAELQLDPEMLEVVRTFEEAFAEFAPPRDDPAPAVLNDDLFALFPEDLGTGQSARGSAEGARVLSVWPEREICRSVSPAGRVAATPDP